MNDLFSRVGSRLPGAKKQDLGGDAYDWLGQFTVSGVSSMGELVGIKPSTTTLEWRAQNPMASLTADLLGTAVPYAGWFAASKKIKAFDKVIEGLGDANKMPFLTGALREAARFAPFEAGRVIASQFVGEEDLGKMAGEAAVNLAVGAGLGGVLQSVASAGTRNFPLAQLAPGIDVAAPAQIQSRYLQDLIDKGSVFPENLPQIQYRLKELRNLGRQEYLQPGVRYVNALEGETSTRLADSLNRMFRNDGGTSGFRRRRFAAGGGDFASTEMWQGVATEAGLPSNFEDFGQYFRHVSFSGGKAAQTAGAFDKIITKGMESLGNGWFLKREADDGLFVMARKAKGQPGKAVPEDQWVVFKTDSPGTFTPQPQKWANIVLAKNAWNPVSKISKDGGAVYNSLTSFMEKFPLTNYRVLLQDKAGIGAAVDKLLPKKFGRRSNELIERFKDAAKEYLAPARMQFTKSPRANWVHTAAKAVYDAAETEGQKLLYGALQLDPKKSLFWSALRGQSQVNEATSVSVKTLLDSLADKEVEELWKVWKAGAHGDSLQALYASGEISQKTLGAAQRLDAIDSQVWTDLNKTQSATGNNPTKKRGGHYGLSHQWLGDTRIALRGDNGNVVAIASGFNRRGAQERAKQIQEALAQEGKIARISEEFEISQVNGIPKDLRPILRTPGFVLEQQGIRGFRWDDTPFTRQELLEGLEGGIRGRLRYQANMSVQDLFMRDMEKLAVEDPLAYRLLTARLNDLAGVQSPFSQLQNQVVDKVLAPIMGNNSASKIVKVANSTMWHLQLGAGKLSYPIVNALTFLQTVVPEVAYVTSAAPEHLAGKYTYFAAGGTRGPVGAFGSLNPLVLMKDSLKAMRKPDQKLLQAFERATNERVIDPRLVEEYIGESATKLRDLRSAISSPGNFAGWLKALSEFLPAQSERLGRAHAFTVGHMIAKDYLKIVDDEAAYRLARQFTENTMFLYTSADRPRVFTTPAGSAFGLFKNWMANYTGTMLEYMGEGVMRNNWSPLLWQTGGTLGVGGLAATPLYMAADGFSKAFAGKDMLDLTYDAFDGEQDWIADGITFGLPAALTGVSLYSQSASPISNPIRDANMLFSTAHLDRLQYFSKAMGAGWDHWQATGEHPGRDQRFLEQLTRAVAPVTLYRVLGAAQDGAINSLGSGYPIVTEAGMMDRLFYMAGFNTTTMDRGYAVAERLFAKKEMMRAEVGRLGEAFAGYQMGRDSEGMKQVLIETYAAGLDPSSVLRSAQSRIAKMTTPMLERNFKPADLERYSSVLGGMN